MRSLSPGCVLNAFYAYAPYLLGCTTYDLHPARLLIDHVPVDLRLHDFALRHQLNGFCLTQAVRTVHAARHAAFHFMDWSARAPSASMSDFSRQTFGDHVSTEDVQAMVVDGQRLAQLERQCENTYVGLVLALDWPRFQATSDAMLARLGHHLLGVPAVQGLLALLRPQWPGESFAHYHGSCHHSRWSTVLTDGR